MKISIFRKNLAKNVAFRRACTLAVFLSFAQACQKGSEGSSTQNAPAQPPPDGGSGASSAKPTVRLSRLTPEQVSNALKLQLNFETGWVDNNDAAFRDSIVEIFGVPLGGVDFRRTFDRDPSPKVHTILVTRSLAWSVAGALVWWEVDPEKANKTERKKIFTLANITSDRPLEAFPEKVRGTDAAKASNAAWNAQLEDLYFRIYARPPKSTEKDLCAHVFTQAVQQSGWVPKGWQIILYAMLSSSEFWNVWGAR